jgi:hypothetical protein
MPSQASMLTYQEAERGGRISFLVGVVATSAPSLRAREALVAVPLLSLGLWEGLYLAAYWLSALL